MFVLNNWKNNWLVWSPEELFNVKVCWAFLQNTRKLISVVVYLLDSEIKGKRSGFWSAVYSTESLLARFGQIGPKSGSLHERRCSPRPRFGSLRRPAWLQWVGLWWKVSPPQVGGGDLCLSSAGRGGRSGKDVERSSRSDPSASRLPAANRMRTGQE